MTKHINEIIQEEANRLKLIEKIGRDYVPASWYRIKRKFAITRHYCKTTYPEGWRWNNK